MVKKVELLAPAGNYEAFIGAVHAGADAVYLGGTKYSARAFADNFDEETLCQAINYAHLFGRKVYLTINTLVKQSELDGLYEYLLPFYLQGLDGVIIQDLGVLRTVRRCFPLLQIHISTQMCITGPYAVRLLKELGAKRIVPARELSLEEMIFLKKEGLKIETFIHGAMCYCYSGRCFFSSLLGGRSGNRGKCAQSCRLPYQTNLPDVNRRKGNTEEYPLSLKDLCTLNSLPDLIEAGIDSFKIEGRMKRPEYAAGVTAIYRKYIDRYYASEKKAFAVDKKDLNMLQNLYIRSELQDGYYHRYNGPEMITLTKPGYRGTDENLVNEIHDRYMKNPLKAEVYGSISLIKESPVTLCLKFKDTEITTHGATVSKAIKTAVTDADVKKQMKKTGNTDFIFSKLDIQMDEDAFLPLKALNELRRQAFETLENRLHEPQRQKREESLKQDLRESMEDEKITVLHQVESANNGERDTPHIRSRQLQIFVSTREQCVKACDFSTDILLTVPAHLIEGDEEDRMISLLSKRAGAGGSVWIKLPDVLRKKDLGSVERLIPLIGGFAAGVVVSDLETYGYLKEQNYTGKICLNHHLYVWNQESMEFWNERVYSFQAPLECNKHEWERLDSPRFSYLCYGRIPMMVTANCIRKTGNHCTKAAVTIEESLTDRYGKDFPVEVNCNYCYNIIYNSVPLSLHGYLEQLKGLPGKFLRLDFTTESPSQMELIVSQYEEYLSGGKYDFSFLKEYTTGHFKKGAL